MRMIGDEYIKNEFRKHKNISPEQALIFLKEWKVSTYFIKHSFAYPLN